MRPGGLLFSWEGRERGMMEKGRVEGETYGCGFGGTVDYEVD